MTIPVDIAGSRRRRGTVQAQAMLAAFRTRCAGTPRNPAHSRHETSEHVDDLDVFRELGDGLLAGQMTDLVDRAHHLAIDGVVQDLLHEAAVDLQKIHREMLQIAERGQAGAEIVERELAAELLQCLDETVGLREARDRRGLGDLEADLGGVEAAAMELIDHVRQKLVIAQALAGKIDRAHR